jgi:hypothetical protein
VRLEGLGKLKNPMTSSGIKSAIFRHVADHYHYSYYYYYHHHHHHHHHLYSSLHSVSGVAFLFSHNLKLINFLLPFASNFK